MKKEEKKPVYTLCPRCELNYITKKDKLCAVCKAEKGLVDKSILLPDDEEIERICPVCKINPLAEDEDICFMCLKEKVKEPVEEEDWQEKVEEEKLLPAEEIEISLELTAEEEDEAENTEFDEQYTEPDDFVYDVDPNDFDEDEDEDPDEDPDEDEDE